MNHAKSRPQPLNPCSSRSGTPSRFPADSKCSTAGVLPTPTCRRKPVRRNPGGARAPRRACYTRAVNERVGVMIDRRRPMGIRGLLRAAPTLLWLLVGGIAPALRGGAMISALACTSGTRSDATGAGTAGASAGLDASSTAGNAAAAGAPSGAGAGGSDSGSSAVDGAVPSGPDDGGARPADAGADAAPPDAADSPPDAAVEAGRPPEECPLELPEFD